MQVIQGQNAQILEGNNQIVPSEGPKGIPLLLDFTTSETELVLDLLNYQWAGRIAMVQTIYIDLSGTDNPLLVTANISNQVIKAKGRTQGYYQIIAPNPVKLTFDGTALSTRIPVIIFNVPIAGAVWSTQ